MNTFTLMVIHYNGNYVAQREGNNTCTSLQCPLKSHIWSWGLEVIGGIRRGVCWGKGRHFIHNCIKS